MNRIEVEDQDVPSSGLDVGQQSAVTGNATSQDAHLSIIEEEKEGKIEDEEKDEDEVPPIWAKPSGSNLDDACWTLNLNTFKASERAEKVKEINTISSETTKEYYVYFKPEKARLMASIENVSRRPNSATTGNNKTVLGKARRPSQLYTSPDPEKGLKLRASSLNPSDEDKVPTQERKQVNEQNAQISKSYASVAKALKSTAKGNPTTVPWKADAMLSDQDPGMSQTTSRTNLKYKECEVMVRLNLLENWNTRVIQETQDSSESRFECWDLSGTPATCYINATHSAMSNTFKNLIDDKQPPPKTSNLSEYWVSPPDMKTPWLFRYSKHDPVEKDAPLDEPYVCYTAETLKKHFVIKDDDMREFIFVHSSIYTQLKGKTFDWQAHNLRMTVRFSNGHLRCLAPINGRVYQGLGIEGGLAGYGAWEEFKCNKSRVLTKGWARYSNPKNLKLHLVKQGTRLKSGDSQVEGTFQHLCALASAKTKGKNSHGCGEYVVYGSTLEFKQKNETVDIEKTFYRIGESPFGEYDTYISIKDMLDYVNEERTNRGDREFPKAVMKEGKSGLGISIDTIEKWEHLHASNKELGFEKSGEFSHSTILTSETTGTKIGDANGKRVGVDAQDVVMGLGAKDIASYCGWTEPATTVPEYVSPSGIVWSKGYQPSEWLHRHGFAFGGLEDGNPLTNFESSQAVKNLVFGTSETNSAMTRHENIYQYFLTRPTNGKLTATITTTSNGKLQSEDPCVTRLEVEDDIVKRKELQDSDIVKFLLTLGEEYPMMCYHLKFEFKYQHASLLNQGNGRFVSYFYPFSRPIFTKFEYELDRLIVQWLDDSLREKSLKAGKK